MSRSQYMSVISRLSTSIFRWRRFDLAEDLASSQGEIRAVGLLRGPERQTAGQHRTLRNSVGPGGAAKPTLAGARGIGRRRLRRPRRGGRDRHDRHHVARTHRLRRQTMPTLESYSMLLGAIALMHRLTSDDFMYARKLLEALIERLPAEHAQGRRLRPGTRSRSSKASRTIRKPTERAPTSSRSKPSISIRKLARPLGLRTDPYKFSDEVRRRRAFPRSRDRGEP